MCVCVLHPRIKNCHFIVFLGFGKILERSSEYTTNKRRYNEQAQERTSHPDTRTIIQQTKEQTMGHTCPDVLRRQSSQASTHKQLVAKHPQPNEQANMGSALKNTHEANVSNPLNCRASKCMEIDRDLPTQILQRLNLFRSMLVTPL